MWRATLDALSTLRPNTEFKPYRAYINHAAYGDMLFTHFDAQPQHQDFFTALWYLCDAWDVEWGGETMFFDERGDALVAVTPRPGRLALFDGRIRHAGRPPNPSTLRASLHVCAEACASKCVRRYSRRSFLKTFFMTVLLFAPARASH
jgi:Rps23 Pro-64 3,4-dihydroxylase Tpa1-like proline 4-hydroxylase